MIERLAGGRRFDRRDSIRRKRFARLITAQRQAAERFQHVQPIGLQNFRQHRAFVMLAATVGSQVHPRRPIARDFEMPVQSPFDLAAAGRLFQHQSLHHLRERRQSSAIDQRDGLLDVFQSFVSRDRQQLIAQFRNDRLEQYRIKDLNRFG